MTTHRDFEVKLSTGIWQVIVEPVEGLTFLPTEPGKHSRVHSSIYIKPTPENRDRLDTIIHETLHAADRRMTEEKVARLAGDIAAVLWKAGYRRVE